MSFFAITRAGVVLLSAQELHAEQLNLTSHNLSNSDTAGFKGFVQTSEEVVYQNAAQGSAAPAISYVKASTVKRDLTQGSLKKTDNAYDFAISGSGYFAISDGDSIVYTRNGHFRLDNQGILTTIDGKPVLSASGSPLNLKGYVRFLVSDDGTVMGMTETGAQENAGKIGIKNFSDQQSLQYLGEGRYSSEDEPLQDKESKVFQGMIEQSNVNSVQELVKMMEINRLYKNDLRLIDLDDEVRNGTINLKV
jgi:flagellar basal-body rod protein FlgF